MAAGDTLVGFTPSSSFSRDVVWLGAWQEVPTGLTDYFDFPCLFKTVWQNLSGKTPAGFDWKRECIPAWFTPRLQISATGDEPTENEPGRPPGLLALRGRV